MFTAKPMVVGCVQHYSTHFVNKLGKSLESFFRKVKKTATNGKNGKKLAKNGPKNGQNSNNLLSSFFWLDTTPKKWY